ncbi:MAG TPA: hypothetical protein VGN01_03635 [Acidobacteriaceae bacterium]
MPGPNRNLSLMLLPQRWDGSNLIANLLLLPNGDPTAPVPIISGSELPFSKAQPVLRAALLPGLAVPSWDPSITPASLTYVPITLAYSAAEQPIFDALTAEYTPTVPPLTQAAGVVRKDLPESYMAATGFATPNAEFFTAVDGFGCAIGSQTPNTVQVPSRTIAWGEILSFALRQPLICQAMGLAYLQVSIPLNPDQVNAGGWIWVEIDTSSMDNWYAKLVTEQPDAVSTYAARLPALTAAQDVFGAILFPTVPGAYDASVMDAAQYEADLYLDGFAKVVHADQPITSDAVTGDSTTIVPGTDAGIQIGWDDEQVTTWVNRQIQIAQAMASGTPTQELPFTVLGYRVDVRETSADPWASLCAASGTLNAASVFSTSFNSQDLCVEPTPIQNAGTGQDYWLPRYFAQWRGRTLVVNDKYGYAFSGGQPPTPAAVTDSDFTGTIAESLSGVNLLYGKSYQFRTRLADLTGGGPIAADPDPDDAGITTVAFRRYVPPKKVALTLGSVDASGNQSLTVDRPSVNYPEMVFTGAADQSTLDALYALTPPQPPVRPFPPPDGSSMTAVPPFQAAVLDSDVLSLQIIVEAEAPTYDTGAPAFMADADTPPSPSDLDGGFRVVYNWQVDFPALSTPVAVGASTPIQLTLQPMQMSQIDSPVLPNSAAPTVLPIPTGRNVRIRLRGLGADDPNNLYYGSSIARTGLTSDIRVRYETATEENLIKAGNLDQQLQAYYLRDLDSSSQQGIVAFGVVEAIVGGGGSWPLQAYENLASTLNAPASTPIQLLASALNLPLTGQTLSAPPGQRILFGAQSSLRHTLPQDRSSITFSSHKDLINHWIVVHRLTLDRDWTWSGLAQSGPKQLAFTFQGVTYPEGSLQPALADLGVVNLPAVVSSLATQQSGSPGQRDTTELIFFSTIDSTVGVGDFPSPTEGAYQLLATLTGNPTTPVQLWQGNIEVPITIPPRQIPQLVSAGIAESEYEPSPDYSSTSVRQRSLWLEFDRPTEDPNDAYFVRVMNYGPDPLLMSNPVEIPETPDVPIALDPEPIRTITPDSVNDAAGLSAMTQAKPSGSSPVHFLVPLPSAISPEALDLFGFWTYEIRCGHLQWSTAQGRFGRPLRVAGVQHPCRHLIATVDRSITVPSDGGAKQPCIVASADLAQTVLNGQSLTSANNPQTQIWFLLYAQLRRADGQAYRNLLLGKLQGRRPRNTRLDNLPGDVPTHASFLTPTFTPNTTGITQVQSIRVETAFSQSEVDAILKKLLLPKNTPLSILAVELFNLEYLVTRDPAGGQVPKALPAALSGTRLAGASATAVATPQTTAAEQVIGDPLGDELGSQRILRVSPLTPVAPIC